MEKSKIDRINALAKKAKAIGLTERETADAILRAAGGEITEGTAVYLDGSPDFAKIAEAYGIRSRTVSSNEEAAGALEEMWADDKPYLLVCQVSPEYPSL